MRQRAAAYFFSGLRSMSAGNPKVFFKYFFVDTTTGEKSGDMLAVAKFSSSDEQPAPENQGGGEGVLWYNDMKYYVLGKRITW